MALLPLGVPRGSWGQTFILSILSVYPTTVKEKYTLRDADLRGAVCDCTERTPLLSSEAFGSDVLCLVTKSKT
jgi:hypothetical protein